LPTHPFYGHVSLGGQVEKLLPVHAKQVLTYIRLANLRLGYLLNFGEAQLKTGIRRLING
jgi:iron complex transport system substrate-binding protein